MRASLTLLLLCLAGLSAQAKRSPSGASLGVGRSSGDAAVVIAVSEYAHLGPVPGADTNGAEWSTWLTQTRGVAEEHVTVLRDGQATPQRMRAAVSTASRAVDPGGRLWVIFIGRGALSPDGEGMLMGADADPTAGLRGALSAKTLLTLVTAGDPSEAVVLLDASFFPLGERPADPWKEKPAGVTLLLPDDARGGAAPLASVGRPAFSYHGLGAVRGWGDADASGAITASEAVAWAHSEMASARLDEVPRLIGPDRVLGRGAEAAPIDIHAEAAVSAELEALIAESTESAPPPPYIDHMEMAVRRQNAPKRWGVPSVAPSTPWIDPLRRGYRVRRIDQLSMILGFIRTSNAADVHKRLGTPGEEHWRGRPRQSGRIWSYCDDTLEFTFHAESEAITRISLGGIEGRVDAFQLCATAMGIEDPRTELVGATRDDLIRRFGPPDLINGSEITWRWGGSDRGRLEAQCYPFWEGECRQLTVYWRR